jgi:hypothetical protein
VKKGMSGDQSAMTDLITSIIPPTTIKIYPNLGLSAIKYNAGGAWRLWEFARFLDKSGSGAILEEELLDLCKSLNVNGGTYQRWLRQAKALGLFRSVYNDKKLLILSLIKTCLTFNCVRINTRRVEMPINCFTDKRWRAFVWSGYEMEFRGHPISRETLYKLTGKHPCTQRRNDNSTEVVRHKNYALSNMNESHLPIEKEHGRHKGLFIINTGSKKVLAWRLPDSRSSETVFLSGKGMSRKVNHILGSYQTPGADAEWIRLFNHTEDQLETTNKKLAKSEHRHPHEIYSLSHRTKGVSLWVIR